MRKLHDKHINRIIIPCDTHRFLRAWRDGGRHVYRLDLPNNCFVDQTLTGELDDLNRDEVLVGDVDEILKGEERHAARQVEPTHLSIIKQSQGTLSFTSTAAFCSVM